MMLGNPESSISPRYSSVLPSALKKERETKCLGNVMADWRQECRRGDLNEDVSEPGIS
jgi:hypothetical protein